MRLTLRTKLLLILLAVVGATVAIGTFAVNNRISAGASREASAQANAYTAQAQALYRERAATLVAEGEAISLYPAVIAAITDGNATPLLAWSGQVTQLQGTKVTVTDATGRVIARGHAPVQYGDNLAQRLEGLRMALAGQKASGVEDGDELGLALRGYAPVRGGGNVIGAVMIADALDDKLLQRLTGNDSGGPAMAVSAITTPADEACRGTAGAAATCQFALNTPGGKPAAQLSLSVPLTAIDSARQDSQQALLLVGGGVLIGGMLAAVVLSASLTRPLQRLTQSAHAMAAGQYDEPVAANPSRDEVGILASAFESMRSEVNKASRQLIDQRDVLDSIVESVDAGILLTEADEGTVLANKLWLELMGNLDLNGKSGLTRTGGTATFSEVANSWLANATLVAQADFEEFSPVYRRLRCYTAPVRGTSAQRPQRTARIFVLRDVTTETEAERMRSAFVATVSHELRSPLTAVKGYTDTLLQAGPWDETTEREFLEVIASSAERLGALIDNLLDASQVEAGVLRLNPEPVRIERVVGSVQRQLAPRLDNHRLEIRVEDALPLVLADPLRVEQVLTNLIENAAKYSPEGGPIRVSVTAGDQVTISVSDSGVGIAPEEQDQVFDRFFRAKTVGQTKGVGLGLYICRSLVEAHGGRIWVTSKPGAGSTFTFTLPRLEEAVDSPAETPSSVAAVAGTA